MGDADDENRVHVSVNLNDFFLPALQAWPVYNGSNMPVVKFVRELNEKATAAGYTEERLARMLPLQLSGAAKIKYDAYDDKTKQDYRRVLDALKRDFRTKNYIEIAKSKLHHVKQEPDEDVVVFGQRVKDLVEDAYSDSQAATIEEIKCETFIRGLITELRIAVMKKRESTHNFQDILKLAEKQQDILEITRREKEQSDKQMINAITDAVKKITLSSSNGQNHSAQRNNWRARSSSSHRNFGYQSKFQPHNPQYRCPCASHFKPRGSFYWKPRPTTNQNRYYGKMSCRNTNYQFGNRSPYRNNAKFPNFSMNANRSNFQRGGWRSAQGKQLQFRDRLRSRSPTPALGQRSRIASVFTQVPTLFLALSVLLLSGFADATNAQYKLCGNGKSGLPVAFPSLLNCSISKQNENILIAYGEVYVQNFELEKFPAAHCFKKVRTICTSSFLHLTLNVDSDNVVTESVPSHTCRSMFKDRKLNDVPLRKLHDRLYDTNNEINYSYPFIGKRCTTSSNIFLEIGEIATIDGSSLISNLGDLGSCSILKNECFNKHGVFIWKSSRNRTRYCKYVKNGASKMYVTSKHILSEELQAVFHFDAQPIPSKLKTKWCIPEKAEKMMNGVFINFPDMKNYAQFTSIREFANKSKSHFHDSASFRNMARKLVDKPKHDQVQARVSRSVRMIDFLQGRIRKRSIDNENDYELNVRSQFLSVELQNQINADFRYLWNKICHLMNNNILLLRAISKTDPSAAARILLHQDNISASLAGDALMVTTCKSVNVDKIYYDNRFGNKCYANTPVLVNNHIMFIKPGEERELMSKSLEIDCAHAPTTVYRIGNKWRTGGGDIHVLEVNNNLPYRQYNEMIFNSAPIFHSEIASLEAISEILSKKTDSSTALATAINISSSDSLNVELDQVSDEAGKFLHSVEQNAKEIVSAGGEAILDSITHYLYIVIPVILFIVLPLLCVALAIWLKFSVFGQFLRCCCSMRRRSHDSRSRNNVNTIELREILAPANTTRVNRDTAQTHDADDDENNDAEENDNTARTKIGPRVATTKFLTYVPIVIGLVHAVKAEKAMPSFVLAKCDDQKTLALVDTGSSLTFINETTFSSLHKRREKTQTAPGLAANGSEIPFTGSVKLEITLGEIRKPYRALIANDKNCPAPLTIGTNFLAELKLPICFDFARKSISIGYENLPMLQSDNCENDFCNYTVRLENDITLPPRSDNFVIALIEGIFPHDIEVIVEDSLNILLPEGIFVGKTLFLPGKERRFPIRIFNANFANVRLYKNQHIANAQVVSHTCKRSAVFSVYEDNLESDQIAKNSKEINEAVNYVPQEIDLYDPTPALSNKNLCDQIDFSKSDLNAQQKSVICDLVNDFRDIFLGNDNKPGRYTGNIRHTIDLIENAEVPKQRLHRVPLQQREEIARQIQEMLKQRIIEPSSSPFCAPIVLVKKKDRTRRFVVDYRRLNAITKSETYIIPNIQEILDIACGKTFYTTLDFKSGFYQIPVEESHRERTAFQCFLGLYQFITMPMGLKGAPGTFQKISNSLIRELRSCTFAYIDDIVTCADDFDQHVRDVRELFSRIRSFGMKLRIDKCVFAAKEVEYLGVLISKNGSRINPKRIASITKYPVPKTVSDVKSFLGAASYFRRYIPNFAKIANPLTGLTRKESNRFIWRTEQQKAFEELKQKLISAPVLAAPRIGQPYEIHTDASTKAVAGTLLQLNPKTNSLHPIAFASRCLNKHERNYSIIELEAMEQDELDYGDEIPRTPRSNAASEFEFGYDENIKDETTETNERISSLEAQLRELKDLLERNICERRSGTEEEEKQPKNNEDNETKPSEKQRIVVTIQNDSSTLPNITQNGKEKEDSNNSSTNRAPPQEPVVERIMYCRFCVEEGYSDSCRNVISVLRRAQSARRDHLCPICLKPHSGKCRKQLSCLYCGANDHHRALCHSVEAYDSRGEIDHHC
ncbi:hypothetical protein Y032_0090g2380 [Ancylostoma ceylanicum]|nr:hypothetical protein Y032_0090g2380 [Ancylostoma ceylanicum]